MGRVYPPIGSLYVSGTGLRYTGNLNPAGVVSVVAKSTARERIEGRQRVWRYLLFAALVVLAVEMLLAARIGRA